MRPHKWAKEIKAWADGAEIEIRQFDDHRNEWLLWHDCDLFTLSQAEKLRDDRWQVRIKPTIISDEDILNAWEKFIEDGKESEKDVIAFARYIIGE
jgi:hypothetical protein